MTKTVIKKGHRRALVDVICPTHNTFPLLEMTPSSTKNQQSANFTNKNQPTYTNFITDWFLNTDSMHPFCFERFRTLKVE